MEYAERGSLADALRRGRLRRADTETPNLAAIVHCLQDVANGAHLCISVLTCCWASHWAGLFDGRAAPCAQAWTTCTVPACCTGT